MPGKMRYSLDQLLSECEPQRPGSPEEQAWLDLAPVGREDGLMPSAQRSGRKLSRLNRRQRKKLRVGEFREFLFELRIRFGVPLDEGAYEEFLKALFGFVESRRLTLGGLGGRIPVSETDAIVSACAGGSPTAADRRALLAWLQERCEVGSAEAGPLVDAWYGNEP